MPYLVTWDNCIGDEDELGTFETLAEAEDACVADMAGQLEIEKSEVNIVWKQNGDKRIATVKLSFDEVVIFTIVKI